MMQLGIDDYLLKQNKNGLLEGIEKAIQRKKANGGKHICPYIAEKLISNLYSEVDVDKPLHENLSPREIKVLCLLAKGKSVTDIASELLLSSKSVSTYKQRLLTKLDLKSTADIVRYAIKEGLLQ